jgi:hypothetical protein
MSMSDSLRDVMYNRGGEAEDFIEWNLDQSSKAGGKKADSAAVGRCTLCILLTHLLLI